MTKQFKFISSFSALICLMCYGTALTLCHACNNEICQIFNISLSQISYMYMCLYLGFFFSCSISGFLADKKGKLKLICFGVSCMICGLVLFTLTKNFIIANISLALIGIGGGANETNVTGYLGDTFKGKRRNQMLNFAQTFFAFGAFLGPILTGFCLKYANYKLGFYIVASICLVGLILDIISILYNQEKIKIKDEKIPLKFLLSDKYLLLMMLCLMFYCGMESGFSEWSSIYYLDVLNLGEVISAQAVGLFWIGISLGATVFGFLAKNIKREYVVVSACASIIISYFVFTIPITILSLIFSFWVGFFLGPVFGTCLGMGSERAKEFSGAASSILFAGAYIGGAFLPALIGNLAQVTNIKIGMGLIPWYAVGIIICVIVGFSNSEFRIQN